MKVIFLDHYGVMCLSKIEIERTHNSLPSISELEFCKPFDDFNIESIKILNSIIEETDAEIVITSDWKKYSDINSMSEFYRLQGIVKYPISFTENLSDGYKTIQEQRTAEVNNYIKSNIITNWVCIDDLYLQLDNFVWCKYPHRGLIDCKKQIISFLD